MRKTRNKIAVFLYLAVSMAITVNAFSFFQAKKDFLIKNFLSSIEKDIAGYTGLLVSIGDIEGGFAKCITAKDIKILYKDGNSFEKILEIDSFAINYKVWDIFLKRFDALEGVIIYAPKFFMHKTQGNPFYNINASGKSSNEPNSLSELSSLFLQKTIKIFIYEGEVLTSDGRLIADKLRGDISLDSGGINFSDVKGKISEADFQLSGHVKEIFANPALYLKGSLQNPFLKGKIAVLGDLNEMDLTGDFLVENKFPVKLDAKYLAENQFLKIDKLEFSDLFDLEASVDFKEAFGEAAVNLAGGVVSISVDFSRYPEIASFVKLNHFKIGESDLIADIDFYARIEDKLFCNLDADNIIVNYKPFQKINCQFSADKDFIAVESINIGSAINIKGFLKRELPLEGELILTADNLDTEDFFESFFSSKETKIAGILNGKFEIHKTKSGILSKGHIEIEKGAIDTLLFERMTAGLEGKNQILYVEDDSRIKIKDGFLILSGFFDTRKFGKVNMMEDIKIASDNKAIVFSGWDIAKEKNPDELNISKPIGKDFNINFKTWTKLNAGSKHQDNKVSELELKYKLKSEDSFLMKLRGENDEFIGMEHKVKF